MSRWAGSTWGRSEHLGILGVVLQGVCDPGHSFGFFPEIAKKNPERMSRV